MIQDRFKVSDLPKSVRPYEKCMSEGVTSLSDAELLAVLIRSGTKEESSIGLAYHLLSEYCKDDNLSGLSRISPEKLCKIKGIGKVKAIQLLCAAEFGRRIVTSERKKRLSILEPQQIAEYFMPRLMDYKQETVWILHVDGKCRIIQEEKIFEGTVKSSLISPREIFLSALEKESVYIFLLHNHPSGDPTPSKEDLSVTKRIHDSGKLLGIELLDHIIIGNQIFVSFVEKGYM